MSVLREKSAHLWIRDEHDWYVEPLECSVALFGTEAVPGKVWDPAVGSGRIVKAARQLGKKAVGSDVVNRSEYCDHEQDFFRMEEFSDFDSIVSNPPFRCAEDFVRVALDRTSEGNVVAMLLPLVWMAGFSTKRDWLPKSPLVRVLPMSPRPSMPPGAVLAAGERAGNGTKDFAWFVWQVGFCGSPEVKFLNTSHFRESVNKRNQLNMEFAN